MAALCQFSWMQNLVPGFPMKSKFIRSGDGSLMRVFQQGAVYQKVFEGRGV